MGSLVGSYTNSAYHTGIDFGTHSHWIQPWRGYLETMPAAKMLGGVGVEYSSHSNPDLVFQHLAKNGVKCTRFEIGWGSNFDYTTEALGNGSQWVVPTFQACLKWGIRPVILLNSNSGLPCPLLEFTTTASASAALNATTITLASVSGIVPGYTGLSNVSNYFAAQHLITSVAGNVCTLARPLSAAIASGATVTLATLKYRPFGPAGTADYNATIAGWKKYIGTVNTAAAGVLGTGGFDLEIWNELTFGSEFLDINNYYTINPYSYGTGSNQDIQTALVQASADYVNANSASFAGVGISNGMANTLPWPTSVGLDPRITALDKHLYPRYLTYPADDSGGQVLTSSMTLENPAAFVPSFYTSFPEYYGTAAQTEHGIRDMAPITTSIYGTNHGRNARVVSGSVVPCPVWDTEIGWSPTDGANGVATAPGLLIKARTSLRTFAFFINKGVDKTILFSTADGDSKLGIVLDSFMAYADANTVYPTSDASYTSPSMLAMRRYTAAFQTGLDVTLTSTAALTVTGISDTHNHFQFAGNGTAAYPNLFNRELFTFLPYQVNATRFVIPYYIMTRDVRTALTPESYTIGISGFPAGSTTVSAYDPINDASVPVTVNSFSGGAASLTVTATDYPYLLVVDAPATHTVTLSASGTTVPTGNANLTRRRGVTSSGTATASGGGNVTRRRGLQNASWTTSWTAGGGLVTRTRKMTAVATVTPGGAAVATAASVPTVHPAPYLTVQVPRGADFRTSGVLTVSGPLYSGLVPGTVQVQASNADGSVRWIKNSPHPDLIIPPYRAGVMDLTIHASELPQVAGAVVRVDVTASTSQSVITWPVGSFLISMA